MAMMRKRQPAARQSSQPQPTAAPQNPLSQFANQGNFGGAAYAAARTSGMSEAQIRDALTTSNLKVGSGVSAALNPGQYDKGWASGNASDLIQRGYYGSGLPSQDGNNYKLEGYVLPFSHSSGLGEQKNVLFMADPGQRGNTYEERLKWVTENFGPGGRYGGSSTALPAPSSTETTASTGTTTSSAASRLPSKIRDASFLGQAIRVAGESGGTVDRKEMKTIARTQGVSMKDIKERLAIVNQKREEGSKSTYSMETPARDFAKGKAKEVAAKAPVATTTTGSAADVVTTPGRTVAEKKNDVLKAARQKMGISEEKRADFAQRSAESKKAKAAAKAPAPAQQAPARQAPARSAAPAPRQAPARQAARAAAPARGRK